MSDIFISNLIGSVQPRSGSFWLPPQYSTQAELVDWPFMFITWICIVFFVGIVVAMLWFMWRYNRARGVAPDHHAITHHTMVELIWSGIPLIIVIAIFYVGFKNYMGMTVAPANSYQIDVTAQQWAWSFEYPNGWSTNELHVPADEPVRLLMKSKDVLHAFFVPDFRVKQDVVPGKFSSVWFQANYDPAAEFENPPYDIPANRHRLFCAEYCGTDHSNMIGWVYVHPNRESYEEWLAKDSDLYGEERGLEHYEIGDRLIQTKGCLSCHTIDGSPKTGPSFKNTWREVSAGQRRFSQGDPLDTSNPTFAEDYILRSIHNPSAQIVDGFPNRMSTFRSQLDQKDINMIIAYFKWLVDNDGHPYDTRAASPDS